MRAREIGGLVLAVYLAAFTIGCQAPKLGTPSGRPEVTITGKSLAVVRVVVIEEFVNAGYVITSQDSETLVLEKEVKEFAAKLAFGTGWDPDVWLRTTINFISRPDGSVRVLCHCRVVSNRGSAFESSFENEQAGPSLQQRLHTCQAKLSSGA